MRVVIHNIQGLGRHAHNITGSSYEDNELLSDTYCKTEIHPLRPYRRHGSFMSGCSPYFTVFTHY